MNLPNKISMARILLLPLIIAFYLIPQIPCGKLIATILFIVASVTDFVDGKIARKYNLVTDLGKFLDPIADKLLVMTGLMLLFIDPFIPVEYIVLGAIIIFARDNLINSLRQIGANKGVVIAAVWSGKIKSTFLYIDLAIILFYNAVKQLGWFSTTTQNAFWWLGVVLFGVSIVLTLWSCVDYFIKNKDVLKESINETNDENKEK